MISATIADADVDSSGVGSRAQSLFVTLAAAGKQTFDARETLNHFARDAGIPLDLAAAVRNLFFGTVRISCVVVKIRSAAATSRASHSCSP